MTAIWELEFRAGGESGGKGLRIRFMVGDLVLKGRDAMIGDPGYGCEII